jgi:hypothetical protein
MLKGLTATGFLMWCWGRRASSFHQDFILRVLSTFYSSHFYMEVTM